MGGADERDRAGDERGGRAGSPALVVLTVGVRYDDVDAGGTDGGVPAAGGERGVGAVAVDGRHGDHPGVGRGVRDVVALLAAVSGRRDDDGALGQGVLHGGVLARHGVRGLAVVAEREVDDVGALVGGPADALGEGRAMRLAGLIPRLVGAFEDDADGEDLRLGGDAEDALLAARTVAVGGDDAGYRGAVAGPGTFAAPGPQADEVPARQDRAREVGMAVVDAGVQDRDGDALALGGVPGPFGVQGVEPPLLGPDLVRVRGRRRQEREGDGGESGGDAVATREPAAVAADHSGLPVAGLIALRSPSSIRSAMPRASWPRPACAGADVAPRALASSADCGSVTVRPSAKPDTA